MQLFNAMRCRGTGFGIILLLSALACAAARAADAKAPANPAAPLRVHVISGSNEYKSESSLKEFTTALDKQYNVTTTASWAKDGGASIDNAPEIEKADLLIVFARRMKLPEEQMALVRKHWESGKPVVGIRTAGHAWQKADNEVFDKQVLGGNYAGHYGNEPVKVTNAADHAEHPVLKGVQPFTSRKLYKAGELAKDATVLQTGDIGKDKQPVTLVNTYKGGRTFFTSLGVPEDFQDENFRRMLTNAIFWTTHRDPEGMKKS